MNTSGIQPVNQNVLVRPDEVDGKIGSILMPDQAVERDQHAQTTGTLIAACVDAFEDMQQQPEAGARVFFARYAGTLIDGTDGEKYRLLKDIDITGVAA
jgi:co-chaperonin GroES (HSP10)